MLKGGKCILQAMSHSIGDKPPEWTWDKVPFHGGVLDAIYFSLNKHNVEISITNQITK